MKLLRLLPCLTVLLLVSCTTENFPDSAVDTLPFSIDEHKDRSVHPGDDFYKYCLGSWLSNTPMPEGKQPDVHALARERVNGVVMNTDTWYRLYNVDRNNHLYLPPERRARIW